MFLLAGRDFCRAYEALPVPVPGVTVADWGKHRHPVFRFGKPVGSNGFVDDREAYVGHPQWRDQPLGGLYWRLVLGRDFPSSDVNRRLKTDPRSASNVDPSVAACTDASVALAPA